MEPINLFLRAIDQTGRIVAGVKPDQLGLPTPCAEWDVRALLNHTIGAAQMFSDAAQGKAFEGARFATDLVGDDPAAAYDQAAGQLRGAVGKPGVLDQMWTMPFGTVPGAIAVAIATVEAEQHGWDVAKATAQLVDFDPELAEAALANARMMPPDQARQPGVFGPEVSCSADAAVHDRLAAFLGRQL